MTYKINDISYRTLNLGFRSEDASGFVNLQNFIFRYFEYRIEGYENVLEYY